MDIRHALVSVVVPVYNEREVLERSFARIVAAMKGIGCKFELVLVDDGSTDGSWEMLYRLCKGEPRARALRFSRNFGHQTAVTAGIDEAKGDAIVIIDADMQDPPEVIVQMVRKWLDGYDIVYGKRIKRNGETAFKRITASLFYRSLRHMADCDIPLDTGDFRLIDSSVADALRSMKEHNRFLRGMTAWAGFSSAPVEYVRDERLAGKTHYTFKKMIKLATNGMLGFSAKPLLLPFKLGIAVILLSIIGTVWAAIAAAAPWLYAFLGVCMLNGLVLCMMGAQGAYLARIHEETTNRPLYLISQRTGSEAKHVNQVCLRKDQVQNQVVNPQEKPQKQQKAQQIPLAQQQKVQDKPLAQQPELQAQTQKQKKRRRKKKPLGENANSEISANNEVNLSAKKQEGPIAHESQKELIEPSGKESIAQEFQKAPVESFDRETARIIEQIKNEKPIDIESFDFDKLDFEKTAGNDDITAKWVEDRKARRNGRPPKNE